MGKNLGHADLINAAADLRKKIEYQISQPDPLVSAEFYYSYHSFIPNYKVWRSLLNQTNPDLKDMSTNLDKLVATEKEEKFVNEYGNFSVFRIENPEKNADQNLLLGFMKASLKLGFSSSFITLRDTQGKLESFYIACLNNDLIQQEDGRYKELENKTNSSKFFALAIATGLIERNALLSPDIVMHPNIKNMVINDTIKQLKAEGIQPLVNEPLVKASMLRGNPHIR